MKSSVTCRAEFIGALGSSWGWESSLCSVGWNLNIQTAVSWAPSNSRWPRGLILLPLPSGNRRPSFGSGQCGKLKQRTLHKVKNHIDYTLREIENKKKKLNYKDRVNTRRHAFLVIGLLVEKFLEVSSKNSWSQNGLHGGWVPSLQG